DVGRSYISARFRHAVGGHMLQGGEDTVGPERQLIALQAAHLGHTQLTGNIGVLAECFLDASPARIAAEVDDGGQQYLYTPRTRLTRDNRVDARDERGVPAAAERDGLGEARGIARHEAMQPFPV